MSRTEFITQCLNGLSYSMLLFLVAVGLTLIFGLMDVLNLSHGSLFMLGGYIGLSVALRTESFGTGSFVLAAAAAAFGAAAAGFLIERVLLRLFYTRGHLDQVLVTLGLVYVIADLCLWTWGPEIQAIPPPAALADAVVIGDIIYPSYRLFLIGFGVALAALLWFVERRTLYGAILRAAVSDREMVDALGVNIGRVMTAGFMLGAFLAGLAGVLGGTFVGVYPGVDINILIISLVVVVIGGLGTLAGSFFGSLLVGLAVTFGAVFVPQYSLFLVFALMAAVLLIRPRGLLGRQLR